MAATKCEIMDSTDQGLPLSEAIQKKYNLTSYEEVSIRVGEFINSADEESLKPRLKRVLDQLILHGGAPFVNRYRTKEQAEFGILMYHRTFPAPTTRTEPTWNVPPELLESQLQGLIDKGYQPIALSEAVRAQTAGELLPSKSFVVTFDDGYANNYLHALPVLEKLEVPATIFLATAYLGKNVPFPSDDWNRAGQAEPDSWRPLTLDETHQLQESKLIELGCHTHTHDDFRGRPQEIAADIQGSLEFMKSELGIEQPTFAFPFGTRSLGFSSDDLIEAARSTGVTCSLSTEHQMASTNESPFTWGRFPAYHNDSARTLDVKLSGFYSKVKNALKNIKRN